MAAKRTQSKTKKPAVAVKTRAVKAGAAKRPAPRRGDALDSSMSVVDGSMKPLIRAAVAKRLRG